MSSALLEVTCPKCHQPRMVKRVTRNNILRGASTGVCRSCATGTIPTELVRCPRCRETRLVTKKTLSKIRHGRMSGKCISCGKTHHRLLSKMTIRNSSQYIPRLKVWERLGIVFTNSAELEDFIARIQLGVCEGCGKISDKIQLDHDHATGKPRAALCRNCNAALANVKDSVPTLKSLIRLLRRST